VTEDADAALARGQALADVKRYDDAVDVIGRAVAANPGDAELRCELARVLYLADRNEEAVAAAEAAALLDPEWAEPHRLRAEALLFLRTRNLHAHQSATTACELEPMNPGCLFTRVRTALALGRPQLASKIADQLCAVAPTSYLGHFGRGLAAAGTRDWETAADAYRAALEITPDDAELLHNYGIALDRLGRHAESMDCFIRSGTLDPDAGTVRNTAIAARRHIGPSVGIWWMGRLALLFLMLAVFSRTAPRPFSYVVAGLALVTCVVLFVARQRRLAKLPNAAKLAMEAEQRRRRRAQRRSP
jgi:tetratricopeptide (TPR) repeat protein